MGVGHKIFDQAIKQAMNFDSTVTKTPFLEKPLAIFSINDKITGQQNTVNQIIVGFDGSENLIKDWQIIDILNGILKNILKKKKCKNLEDLSLDVLCDFKIKAENFISKHLSDLDIKFSYPQLNLLSLFIPG